MKEKARLTTQQAAEPGAAPAAPDGAWATIFDDPEAIDMDTGIQQYAWWHWNGSPSWDAVVTNFISCGQFEGSRDGWAFKTGTLGLGYYREGVPDIQQLLLAPLVRPLGELCKAELSLNELLAVVGDPLRMTADDEPSRPHRMLPALRNCNQEKN